MEGSKWFALKCGFSAACFLLGLPGDRAEDPLSPGCALRTVHLPSPQPSCKWPLCFGFR